jgi:hypothetical protein
LFSYIAAEFGTSAETVKIHYKRVINPELYIFQENFLGEKMARLKSSAELTKEEMMISIDKLHAWYRENADLRLPQAEDREWIRELENQVEKHDYWLKSGIEG